MNEARPIDANALAMGLLSITRLDCDSGYYKGRADERDDILERIKNAPTLDVAPVRRGEWVSVEDRPPDNGTHVLLCCEIRPSGRKYVCDGFCAAKHSIEGFAAGELGHDYNEEDDTYYIPEGYYEVVKNWDDFSSIAISDFVTHWMPLPEPPNCGADMRVGNKTAPEGAGEG